MSRLAFESTSTMMALERATFAFVRPVRLSYFAIAVLALTLVTCDGGGRGARLRIELAGASDSICDSSFMDQRAPCSTVRVYQRSPDGRLAPLRLSRPGNTDDTAITLRFEGSTLLFDADFGTSVEPRGDLELRVYGDDGSPLAAAVVEDVDFASADEIRVRLYPYSDWSCPGAHESGELLPRAFHRAVALDDGNVLILGGVTSVDPVDTASVVATDRRGATLQRQVEIYDSTRHRFRRLEVTDLDGQDGFGRVLFDAYYLGSTPVTDGREHRVRIIGGLTIDAMDEGAVALRFDSRGTLGGPFGSPVSPQTVGGVGRAVVGTTLDLIYNSASDSVTLEDATPVAAVPRGGLVTISSFLGAGAPGDIAAVLLGLGPSGGMFVPVDTFYGTRRDGASVEPARTLNHRRMGATVSEIQAHDVFLIWGGNVGDPTGPLLSAGEIHSRTGTTANVISALGAALPPPTAFHESTVIGSNLVLISGGYLVAADGNALFTPSTQPLMVLEVQSSSSVVARPIDASGWTNAIFHTSSPVEGLGVLLAGGATVDASENRLVPSDQVGFVSGFMYTPLPPLRLARFGHSTTPLSGRRVLVVGGFTSVMGTTALLPLRTAEMIFHEAAPRSLMVGECSTDQVDLPDGGVGPMDSGLPPILDGGGGGIDGGGGGIDAGVDAGPPGDAGPPIDAGPAIDAG